MIVTLVVCLIAAMVVYCLGFLSGTVLASSREEDR